MTLLRVAFTVSDQVALAARKHHLSGYDPSRLPKVGLFLTVRIWPCWQNIKLVWNTFTRMVWPLHWASICPSKSRYAYWLWSLGGSWLIFFWLLRSTRDLRLAADASHNHRNQIKSVEPKPHFKYYLLLPLYLILIYQHIK